MVIIVPDEGIHVEALQIKYPIIGWEVYSEGTMQFWKIIRVGNYTEVYQVFEDMLKNFNRDDLVKLWSLVQERYNSSGLTEEKEIELWLLYDMCAVHHVSTEKGQDIFMLVEKDYPLTKGLATLMLCNKLRVDQQSEMADELLIKIYNIANRPRKIEQYFQVQDYALWEVIEYGNSFKPVARTITNADGSSTSTIPGPVTTEEKAQEKNDVKARSMLLMALPNEHQLTFSQYKDAKTLFDAIQERFGGNKATKKTQRTLLKKMYENFSTSSQESLDSISNRLQKIVSQLAILDLGTISFDDLYNNFKIVEQEVKRSVTSSSNSSSQNVAFVSTPGSSNEDNTANVHVNTASTNVNTASTNNSTASLSDAIIYAFLANQPNGSQVVHEDLEQIHEDDLEEMDLKWQLALLSLKARKFYQRTGKKIIINGSDTAGYDKSKVKCFNCHKMGYFARECRGHRNQESRPRKQESRPRNQESSKRTVNVEDTSSKAMGGFDFLSKYPERVLFRDALALHRGGSFLWQPPNKGAVGIITATGVFVLVINNRGVYSSQLGCFLVAVTSQGCVGFDVCTIRVSLVVLKQP
ncbi:putative ribonuclease H-like domain-containing protein [Tanacetum coccineum]|uniref:Ribonuclease H-like domain-containing protein n=1 Tax=Tanacetum coccineum TaxID=301880 RepID=A0ABQ5CYM0_9ASTR